jgi:NADH:ubiquinone oxidoreductase subunit 5 (subunit L)/multisubunit Na+/H+ antiporter MnhA subunit
MTIALAILAFLGVFGGHFWLIAPHTAWSGHAWFEWLVTPVNLYGKEIAEWVAPTLTGEALEHYEHNYHTAHNLAVIVSLLVAFGGIAVAAWLYVWKKDIPAKVAGFLGLAYTAVRKRYYIDEFVNATVIRGTWVMVYTQKWFDENVVDGLVKSVGGLNKAFGAVSAWFDKTLVDGAVNAVALASQVFGAAFRLVQTGRIQQYAAFAVGGALLTAAWLLLA